MRTCLNSSDGFFAYPKLALLGRTIGESQKIRSDFSFSIQYGDLNDSQHNMLTAVVDVAPSCGFRGNYNRGAIV